MLISSHLHTLWQCSGRRSRAGARHIAHQVAWWSYLWLQKEEPGQSELSSYGGIWWSPGFCFQKKFCVTGNLKANIFQNQSSPGSSRALLTNLLCVHGPQLFFSTLAVKPISCGIHGMSCWSQLNVLLWLNNATQCFTFCWMVHTRHTSRLHTLCSETVIDAS